MAHAIEDLIIDTANKYTRRLNECYLNEHRINNKIMLRAFKKELVNRACHWLKQEMLDNLVFQGRLERDAIIKGIINNFRTAMEE